jgi:hypothetical protein
MVTPGMLRRVLAGTLASGWRENARRPRNRCQSGPSYDDAPAPPSAVAVGKWSRPAGLTSVIAIVRADGTTRAVSGAGDRLEEVVRERAAGLTPVRGKKTRRRP